jgi:hypothetical protein
MVEIFATSVLNEAQAGIVLRALGVRFPNLKVNFDLEGFVLPFPCGHNILRVEGAIVDSEGIVSVVHLSGFLCSVLEDKVCR